MKQVLMTLMLCFSSFSFANYYCLGEIKHLGVDSSTLHVSNGFGVHKLCNVSEEHCKAWMSMGLSAKMSNRQVVIYYKHPTLTGNLSGSRCNEIGDWVVPEDSVYYFQVY
ncbi:hypothetical protein KCG43_16850 [Photobacterium sp. WH24]|uniref:hypothetical protein n=1 Tax=Photobacterium TaxID=657 RepID=UPI001C497913|nr:MULTISPECIES: hypothetical protein [Photobacterium]MBV7263676.1 hypothetical protein [Photobacterium sp. WH24]